MGVLQFQSLSKSLLLKFTDTIINRFNLVFLLHLFRPCLTEQMNFIAIQVEISQHLPGQSPARQKTKHERTSMLVPDSAEPAPSWSSNKIRRFKYLSQNGYGVLLKEHASTAWSGVEAPREASASSRKETERPWIGLQLLLMSLLNCVREAHLSRKMFVKFRS